MSIPAITSKSLWDWDTTGNFPVVRNYSSGQPTKTGLMPADLLSFCRVPLQSFNNPPQPIDQSAMVDWIRYAEDSIEQATSLLLCQTWVASPPEFQPTNVQAIGIKTTFSGGFQKQGFDYDLEDAAYDFVYSRAQDEGWMALNLRYRPVRSLNNGPNLTLGEQNPVKNIAYVYPLLNDYFNVPWQWIVTDSDFGLIRLVPSVDVAMLPLFAMQLAFMGFAQSVPGGIHLQYTAGLTPMDYQTRFSFVKQLVLVQASIIALGNIQGTVNLGATDYMISQDGMTFRSAYDKDGPFAGVIRQYERQREALMAQVRNQIGGVYFSVI